MGICASKCGTDSIEIPQKPKAGEGAKGRAGAVGDGKGDAGKENSGYTAVIPPGAILSGEHPTGLDALTVPPSPPRVVSELSAFNVQDENAKTMLVTAESTNPDSRGGTPTPTHINNVIQQHQHSTSVTSIRHVDLVGVGSAVALQPARRGSLVRSEPRGSAVPATSSNVSTGGGAPRQSVRDDDKMMRRRKSSDDNAKRRKEPFYASRPPAVNVGPPSVLPRTQSGASAVTSPDAPPTPQSAMVLDSKELERPFEVVPPTTSPGSVWCKVRYLGAGGNGMVHLARNDLGELAAVKTIAITDEDPKQMKKCMHTLKRELSALKQLGGHPNVVQHFKAVRDDNQHQVHIIMEYCEGGCLRQAYLTHGPIALPRVARVIRDVLRGLNFLHSCHIIHRDVKAANVLLDSRGVAKMADFGAAAILHDASRHTCVGTVHWMAPEVLDCRGHRWHADIWGVGCTVIELLTGRPPFVHISKQPRAIAQYLLQNFDINLAIPKEITDPDAIEFIKACLQIDREQRPNCIALLSFPFITKYTSQEYLNSASYEYCPPAPAA